MQVQDAMSTTVLTIGPQHSLRQTAQAMKERHVGAAVVVDPGNDRGRELLRLNAQRALAAVADLWPRPLDARGVTIGA